jgi:hypothetical protein
MTAERAPQEYTSYAYVILSKVTGGFIAGVVIKKKGEKPYKVGSVFLEDAESFNKAILTLGSMIIDEVEDGTKLLIIKGPQNFFNKKRTIETKLNIIAHGHGLGVLVFRRQYHAMMLHELNALANDAGERRSSIFVQL